MASCEVIEKLTKRVIEYLTIDLGIDKIDNDFCISEVDMLQYHNNTVFMNFSADLGGTVGLSVSDNLAKIMVKKFIFGEVSDEIVAELLIETVQEILNIVSGNIIKDLDIVKKGGSVEISTPYTMEKNSFPTKEKYSHIYISKIKYSDEEITLSYFYK
jgi:CheY-specific phosphatase CheX